MEQQRQKGPIEKLFDWTLAILFIAVLVGVVWKYVLKPLYLG